MAKRLEQVTDIEILAAAWEYLSRRDRVTHPSGSFDKAYRWYPDAVEMCGCCDGIRPPSCGWPYSLLVHCRTADHVAALRGVSALELKRAARQIEREKEEANHAA